MNTVSTRLALVPIFSSIAPPEPLLLYETTAAKLLKISIHQFRQLVRDGVVPFRLHSGRSKRLYLLEDLRVYARNLKPQYAGSVASSGGSLKDI